jgi:hypothetical protein
VTQKRAVAGRGDALPMRRLVTVASVIAAVLLANPLRAEQAATPASGGEESNSDLAKKTQNPVADLISVPFQNNFNFNTGPEKRSVWDLNIQPVIPIHLTDDWNLITRTIVPIINQPPLAPGIDQATGLGDINPSFFLSPSGSKEFIWGIGPTFTFPTASNRLLGMGKWSMGPAAVALTMQGPWVAGALINTPSQSHVSSWADRRTVPLALPVRCLAPGPRLPIRRSRCGQRARMLRSRWRKHEPVLTAAFHLRQARPARIPPSTWSPEAAGPLRTRRPRTTRPSRSWRRWAQRPRPR